MMRTTTFPQGGIHPPERKRKNHGHTINAIIPRTSIVPLLQHDGEPARPVVGPGDRVREGMLIGAGGERGANIHAPVPGIVREIRPIRLAGGIPSDAIVIDMDGEFDLLGRSIAAQPWDELDRAEILGRIEACGVVDMAERCVPAHRAFAVPDTARCDLLIVNGSESEPYVNAEHRIMVERAPEVVRGARIVERLVRATDVVIAVGSDKPDAIHALEREVHAVGYRFRIVRLAVKYPQGDERQLVRAVSGREIPSGGRALDVRCATLGVAAASAVYDAVVYRQPVIERVLTVAGGAIARPANIKARIGTPIGALIEECGGFVSQPAKIVIGGPLVGRTVASLDTPVTKGTRAVLALTAREVRGAGRLPCIQCGRCVEACPMGLNPTRLFKLIDHHEVGRAIDEGLFDCTECGACGYICPSRLPLVQGMRIGKSRAVGDDRV